MNASPSPLVLVTGGSAGLGRVVGETFLADGYDLAITGRDESRVNQVVAELRDAFPDQRTVGVAADGTSVADCQRVAGGLRDEFGRLDVLVNCIGTSDRGLVVDLEPDRLGSLLAQNVTTMLNASQAMLPLLKESAGSIVNVGSLAGKVGARYLGGYVAAKHAVTGLTQQMRLELRDEGVHVALVSPGPIRREDAGTRYDARASDSLPSSAKRPGGGTKVKGLDAHRVARVILLAAKRKRTDVIMPGYLRLLMTIGNAFPRLGDWILLKLT
ncbi:MAG: SDR family NAD(P)-dependent oxidoreductase [Planctomycetota bacterium]